MRTIDRFLAGRTVVSPAPGPARVGPRVAHAFAQAVLPTATVIVADNVAEYVHARKSKEWLLEEVGCLAPPWPVFWIEYHNEGTERRGVMAVDLWPAIRTQILHGREGHDFMESQEIPEIAAMVIAEDSELKEAYENDEREILYNVGRELTDNVYPPRPDSLLVLGARALQDVHDQGGVVEDVRFCVALLLFGEMNKQVIGPVAWLVLALDRYGRPLGNRWQLTPELHDALKLGENDARDDANFAYVLNMLHPALQTMAFLHCRNVVTDTVRPNPKLSHKHQKRTGRPLMRYQTVRLEVPRRAGVGAAGEGSRGTSSLHIVAGHMAHYGECGCPSDAHPPKGKLFGKLDGIFWVPDHARGDRGTGVVATDFEVVV